MLMDAVLFLLQVVFDLVASAFWMRFYMQWARVPFHNPFAQFISRVTDFAVRPLRRVVPGLFGLDLSSLLLFLATELVFVLLSQWLMGFPFLVAGFQVLPGFLLLSLAAALRVAVYVSMGLVLIQAVLSWVNPFSPFMSVFQALARPLVGPFQRIIPPIGGVDLSPLATLVALQLVLMLPVLGLERLARSMIW